MVANKVACSVLIAEAETEMEKFISAEEEFDLGQAPQPPEDPPLTVLRRRRIFHKQRNSRDSVASA